MSSSRSNLRQKVLGLAVTEKSMLLAELSTGAGEESALKGTRLAEFTYPEGMSLESGEVLGAELARFLKAAQISSRQVVVGIPAKWIVVKPKPVPPADPATIAESLRLLAEGDFSQSLNDLVFDYAGETSTTEASQVLLMATPRKHVDQIVAVADAARLEVVKITASAASLGWATAQISRDAMVLSLSDIGAEFAAQSGLIPCALRHLGPAPREVPGQVFLSELRRTASTLPPHRTAFNGRSGLPIGRELVIYNGFSQDTRALQTVGEALGVPVRQGDLTALGVAAPTAGEGAVPNPAHFAPAVALALAGMRKTAGAVDFLHSRLAPPKEHRFERKLIWGAIAAVVSIGLLVAVLINQHIRQGEVDDINQQLDLRKDQLATAKADVDMIQFARGWEGGTPHFLPCLRDLTLCMPTDGQTFLTQLTLHEDMKGILQGKSSNSENISALRIAMQNSGVFGAIQEPTVTLRQTGKNGHEAVFTIHFIYIGHD